MILASDAIFFGGQRVLVLATLAAAMTTAIPLRYKLYPADCGDLLSKEMGKHLPIIDAEIHRQRARIAVLEAKRADLIRGQRPTFSVASGTLPSSSLE